MAYADPQTITIDGTAHTLARSFEKDGKGTFSSTDGAYALEITPTNGRSKIRQLKLRGTKITSDPLVSTTNVRVSDLITITINRPNDGYSDAEVVKQVAGLFAWMTASTNANLIKFVAGEN